MIMLMDRVYFIRLDTTVVSSVDHTPLGDRDAANCDGQFATLLRIDASEV